MGKIHLIMPIGGGGIRFGNKGFRLPKPLIDLQGRPFFYWAAQSVLKYIDVEDVIFVVLQEHIEKFGIDQRIHEYYPQAGIQVIPRVLNGAVLTCCEGIRAVTDDKAVLFNDCDHAFVCHSFYSYCKAGQADGVDGALLTFQSHSPNYSYVRFDRQGNVSGTVEKKAVSSEAICGAYYFRNRQVFQEAVAAYLEHCTYNEYYMSGVYNEMVAGNRKVVTFSVDEHISFGTPEEYDTALCDERLGALR